MHRKTILIFFLFMIIVFCTNDILAENVITINNDITEKELVKSEITINKNDANSNEYILKGSNYVSRSNKTRSTNPGNNQIELKVLNQYGDIPTKGDGISVELYRLPDDVLKTDQDEDEFGETVPFLTIDNIRKMCGNPIETRILNEDTKDIEKPTFKNLNDGYYILKFFSDGIDLAETGQVPRLSTRGTLIKLENGEHLVVYFQYFAKDMRTKLYIRTSAKDKNMSGDTKRKPLTESKFVLQRKSTREGSDENLYKDIYTKISDGEGYLVFDLTEPGDYRIKQVQISGKYSGSAPGIMYGNSEYIEPWDGQGEFFLDFNVDKYGYIRGKYIKRPQVPGKTLAQASYTAIHLVYTKKQSADFKLVKIDSGNSNKEGVFNCIPGAVFKLYKYEPNSYEDDTLFQTCISGQDGMVEFKNVPPGEYVIFESKAPDGYVKAGHPMFKLIVDENLNVSAEPWTEGQIYKNAMWYHESVNPPTKDTETGKYVVKKATDKQSADKNIEVIPAIKNRKIEQSASIMFVKTAYSNDIQEDRTTCLPGAEFTLYKKNVQTNDFDIIAGHAISGEDGIVIFDQISKGEYKIKETKAPTGYSKTNDVLFHFLVNDNYKIKDLLSPNLPSSRTMASMPTKNKNNNSYRVFKRCPAPQSGKLYGAIFCIDAVTNQEKKEIAMPATGSNKIALNIGLVSTTLLALYVQTQNIRSRKNE